MKSIGHSLFGVFCLTALTLAQYSDRLWKNIESYDRSDANTYLGVNLFHTPAIGEAYIHPYFDNASGGSSGSFYQMAFVVDENWNRVVYGRGLYNDDGEFIWGSDWVWAFGSEGKGDNEFSTPRAVTVTYADIDHVFVYVSDWQNSRIKKMKVNVHTGEVVSVSHFYANEIGDFSSFWGIAVNHRNNRDPSDDIIIVVDRFSNCLIFLDASGNVLRVFDEEASEGYLRFPLSVEVQRSWTEVAYFEGNYGSYFLVYVGTWEHSSPSLAETQPPWNYLLTIRVYDTGDGLGPIFLDSHVYYGTGKYVDLSSDLTGYTVYAVDLFKNNITKYFSPAHFGYMKLCGQFGTKGYRELKQLYMPTSISLPTILYHGGKYWGGYYGGIMNMWTLDTGAKYFEEGVDVLELTTSVNSDGTLMSYSYKTPSGIGYKREVIKNSNGQIVRVLKDNVLAYMDEQWGNWDRRDDNGVLLPPGSYTLEVTFRTYWRFSDGTYQDEITRSSEFMMSGELAVTIDGPTHLESNEVGTFTANPSGGSGEYVDYRWWERNDEGTIGLSYAGDNTILAPTRRMD